MTDIVYFVKESLVNEELRYSLRTLSNLQHGNVWFIGGCPLRIKPDRLIRVNQNQPTKYDNVHEMLRIAATHPEITDDFYLFNDDFFIMKPWVYKNYYRGDLYKYIVDIENKYGITQYTKRLRKMVKILESKKCETRNFELHIPMRFNKKKLLKILDDYPGVNGVRSLYGNIYKLNAAKKDDVKIFSGAQKVPNNPQLLSTEDEQFNFGAVGNLIRSSFTHKSPYEQ